MMPKRPSRPQSRRPTLPRPPRPASQCRGTPLPRRSRSARSHRGHLQVPQAGNHQRASPHRKRASSADLASGSCHDGQRQSAQPCSETADRPSGPRPGCLPHDRDDQRRTRLCNPIASQGRHQDLGSGIRRSPCRSHACQPTRPQPAATRRCRPRSAPQPQLRGRGAAPHLAGLRRQQPYPGDARATGTVTTSPWTCPTGNGVTAPPKSPRRDGPAGLMASQRKLANPCDMPLASPS